MMSPVHYTLLALGAYIVFGLIISIIHWMVDGKSKTIADVLREIVFCPFMAIGLIVAAIIALCSARFWNKKILPARPKEMVRILVEGNTEPEKIPYKDDDDVYY